MKILYAPLDAGRRIRRLGAFYDGDHADAGHSHERHASRSSTIWTRLIREFPTMTGASDSGQHCALQESQRISPDQVARFSTLDI